MIKNLLNTRIGQTALIAICYFVSGALGLLLALPPGFASLVWPPLGLSIAALLLWGTNRWPGVYLGALLINLRMVEDWSGVPPAMIVALGNSLGVVIATTLIRHKLSFPKRFYLEKEIFLFLLIAGPLAAILTATAGTGFLYWFGLIPARLVFMNWLYWFVGDCTGGLIFAPLALMFANTSRRYWVRSLTKVLLPVCLFFSIILFAVQYLNRTERDKVVTDFTRKAEFTVNFFEQKVLANIDQLRALQSFFLNSDSVTRQEFKEYSQTLYSRYPEVQALAWIPYNRSTPDSFIIDFVEPAEKNKDLTGKDLGLNKQQLTLLKKALIHSSPVMSLDSSSPNTSNQDLFMYLAVGHPSGVLLEVLRFEHIFEQLENFVHDKSISIALYDVTEPQKPQIFMVTSQPEDFHADTKWSSTINVGDRVWQLNLEQDTSLSPDSTFNSGIFLLGSMLFTFLICSMLLIVTNRVITTQSLVEEKTVHLKELNLQLEKASQTKSDFLANMSHEIRTPLNVIIGMSDLLSDSPLTSEQKHYSQVAQKAGDTLLNIINDILDISKIESGLISLEKIDVNLMELIKEVQDFGMLRAQEKNLHLLVNVAPEVSNIYSGDPTRIRQILANLVGNALKFTSHGVVKINAERNQDTSLKGNILISVVDTGVGIAPDKIDSLFKPFTQADSSITRKFGGTGLGLSISKRLVEMMGGEIHVKSTLHQGSTFYFTLDLPMVSTGIPEAIAPVIAEQINPANVRPLKILIADDSEDNRLLLRAYLKETPHQIYDADDGVAALDFIKDHEIDIVLMDMQMPVMDGLTATKKIRAIEKETRQNPMQIWAVTAYALESEVSKSIDAGCDRHLVKPVRKSDLLQHIQAYLAQK